MHAMEGPSELRLPKAAVGVELARVGSSAEHVEVFLDAGATGVGAIAAQIADLLEVDGQFLPVREPDAPGGPRVSLIGKRSIVWLAVPHGPDEPSEVLNLFDHRHEVKVELDDGLVLDGTVLYSSPADRPRLTDHLNLPARFLRVWTPTAQYLVNKQHVTRVLELD